MFGNTVCIWDISHSRNVVLVQKVKGHS